MRLAGRVALVTGTSPNIGAGIAEALADEGAAVACLDADAGNAEQCAAYLRGRGAEAIGVPCDVTDEAAVTDALGCATDELGLPTIVVNGAVRYVHHGLLEMPLDEFRRQVDIILGGTFLVTKHAAAAMVEAAVGGSIINVASTEGHQGNVGNIGYTTAKAGLLNFTRSAAMDLAPHGIRVNSLTPTSTDPTEAVERAVAWGWPRVEVAGSLPFQRARALPLGRPPAPSDYGKAAVFLASDDARMITAFDLRVDAGAIGKFWAWPLPAAANGGSDDG